MMRQGLEKGLAALIARFLLESRHEALFASIARAGALPPEEIDRLREETLAHLRAVRDEGAPYADAMMVALREIGSAVLDGSPGLRAAGTFASRTAGAAVRAAMKGAGAAIPDPPAGRAPVPDPLGSGDEPKR